MFMDTCTPTPLSDAHVRSLLRAGEGHELGEQAENWLLRYGGWFPDPQICYDGFPPPDTGVDGPCSEIEAGLAEAELIILLNGAIT